MLKVVAPGAGNDRSPLGLELLRHVASDPLLVSCGARLSSQLQTASAREIRWLLQAGWGALIYGATRACDLQVPAAWRESLLSAELTAQVTHGDLIDTAIDIIDVCRSLRTDITLLKGISVSDQYYPAAHLRPMEDIDVLVPTEAYQSVESALLSRGYLPDPEWPKGHFIHHGAPLLHPDRQVWVELHTALFPSDDRLRCNRTFSPEGVADRSVASRFHGRPVTRLSDELQLVYSASSWMRDLMRHGPHPSFLNSLLDVVYLLNATRPGLKWGSVNAWLDNESAKASLYVTLSYVARRRLAQVPSQFISQLGSSQEIVGFLQLQLIHTMLDRCLLGGKAWFRWIPFPYLGRFSLHEQLRKRLASSVNDN